MLRTCHDESVVVGVDRLEGKSSSSRTSNWSSNPSRKVPHRWPEPSEGSAVLTGLRLGRAGRARSRSLFADSTICNAYV